MIEDQDFLPVSQDEMHERGWWWYDFLLVTGDEAYPVGREYPAQIPACFDVLAPQPGEVFYDDAVDVAVGDILHHFLERRAVKS